MTILLIVSSFFILLGVLEVLYRRRVIANEQARKIGHIFAGCMALAFSLIISRVTFVTISVAFACLVYIGYTSRLLSAFTSQHRKTLGVVTLPLGLAVLGFALYENPAAFAAGILILTFSDTAACVIGFPRAGKSIRGSIAFFLVTVVILAGISSHLYFACSVAAVLTIVEKYSMEGLDNLSIPLVYTVIILVTSHASAYLL